MNIHPFLFAIYPILFLFAHNIKELDDISIIFMPITIMLLLTYFSYVILKLILKERAGLFLSTGILLSSFYGPLYDLLDKFSYYGIHKTILLLYIIVLFSTTKIRIKPIYLNVTSSFLVLVSLFNIGIYFMAQPEKPPVALGSYVNPPNIYCIILDMYSRDDVLKKVYGYDNTEFLDYLKKKGFYVSNDSKSIYPLTYESMASLFNFSYLSDKEKDDCVKKFRNNKVFSLMKQYGYTTVFISSFAYSKDINNTDFYLTYGCINRFYIKLLNLTFVPYLLRELPQKLHNVTFLPFLLDGLPSLDKCEIHRRKVNYVFDALRKKWKNPFFVYAHIVSPHPTYFAFESNGQAKNNDNSGYIPQLKYVNKKMMSLIDDIMEEDKEDMVILIQSDHGFPGPDVLSNLSASYPDPPPNISVNTFRMIFNRYFGMDYKLLEDRVVEDRLK